MSSTPGRPTLLANLWQRAESELSQKERDQLAKAKANGGGASSTSSVFASTKASLEKSTQIFQERSLSITFPTGLQGGKRKILLRDIFRRAVQWLGVVTSVGDKIVQFDASGHAALPWAGVKLLVELVTSDVKKYDGVIQGVGTVVHNLTFYSEWQRLYTNRPVPSEAATLFEDALVELYAAILRYEAATLQYFEQNRLVRIGKGMSSAFVSSGRLEDQLDKLTQAETQAAKVARLLDADLMQRMNAGLDSIADQLNDLKVAHEAGNVKVLSTIEASVRPLQAVVDYVDSEQLLGVLNWFSTAPFQTTHDSIYEKVVPDTGAWLLQHVKFQDWKLSPKSSVLWLHGTMGMGKSSLASIVIEHLQIMEPGASTSKIAFFYFVGNSGRNSDRDALAALARQLAIANSTSQLLSKAREIRDACLRKGLLNASESSAERLRDTVADLATQYGSVWLVLDALDESDDAAEVVEAMQTITEKCKMPVKVFLTSRESSAENPGLSGLYEQGPHLSIRDGMQSGDIASFVDVRMSELIKKKKMLGGLVGGKEKDEVAAKLRHSILKHADGMFRWAEMRLIELCSSKYRLKSSILKAIDQPPRALSEIYNNIYHGLCEDGETTESRLAKAVLAWIVYSRTPMEETQILEAARVYSDSGLEKDEVNVDLMQALLPGFFNVVTFPTNDLSVLDFAHLSVREHFENHEALSLQSGHAAIATACLQKLIFYANEFKSGALSTVVDAATAWPTFMDGSNSRHGVDVDRTSAHGSLIIAQNFQDAIEHMQKRMRIRKRRLLLGAQQVGYGRSDVANDYASDSSSSSEGSSLISETAAVVSAPYVRVRKESDIFFLDEWMAKLETMSDDNGDNDSQVSRMSVLEGNSAQANASKLAEEDHQPSSYSMDVGYSRPRSQSMNDCFTPGTVPHDADRGTPFRSRSYSLNDMNTIQTWPWDMFAYQPWRSGYIAEPSTNWPRSVPDDRPGVSGNYDFEHDYETGEDISSHASSSSGTGEPLEFEVQGTDDWNRYPLIIEQRRKFRKLLRTGQMAFEEFEKVQFDILRTTFLQYARMHWHYHLARSAYDRTTMTYLDADLQKAFEEFSDVSPTREILPQDGLPFVLWYDWLRQDYRYRSHDLNEAIRGQGYGKRDSKTDRWLTRLNDVCKLAGLEPGCSIAESKIVQYQGVNCTL